MKSPTITIRLPADAIEAIDRAKNPWQSRSEYLRDMICREVYASGGNVKSGKPYIVGERPCETAVPNPPTYEEYLAIREGIAPLSYWEYESAYDSREAFLQSLTKGPPFMDALADYRAQK